MPLGLRLILRHRATAGRGDAVKQTQMVLFHRTAHASAILEDGFRDGRDDRPGRPGGVWLSTALSGCGDGAADDAVLVLKLPMGAIRQYEQLQVGQTYRTFLVPANVVNEYKEGRLIVRTSWMRVRVEGLPAETAH